MDWILTLIAQYNAAIKINPILATLMIPVIGGVMYYIKDIPAKIWAIVVKYTTVTMSLNNAGWDGNADAYNAFDRWFMASGYKRLSRNFFMFRQFKDDLFANEVYSPYRLGIGKGFHFFFYNRRFFWFSKGSLNSAGSEKEKEEISVTTLGWSHGSFECLVALFNTKKEGDTKITMHKYSHGDKGWEEVGESPIRDIKTFCMNEEIKQSILKQISDFIARREWYASKGLTYKTSFLFEGPPGTGKTSLAKFLAMHFRRDLYILDLTQHTNGSLVEALSKMKPGSFLLMEDVDQAGNAVKNRDKGEKKKGKAEPLTPAAPSVQTKVSVDFGSDGYGLTMSGMLNAFDGVVSLDNVVIMMTTNHPEDLDPAILRKSRIDNRYHIGPLTGIEIHQYMLQMYDDLAERENYDELRRYVTNRNIVLEGCEVENAFKEHPDTPEAFLEEVTERSYRKYRAEGSTEA